MTEIEKLIARARELAALRKKATPGKWEARMAEMCCPDRGTIYVEGNTLNNGHFWSHGFRADDATFIAAAPEMAELLEKLARELDDAYKIAVAWCEDGECVGFRASYGKHDPNCFAEKMGWAKPWSEEER